MNAPGARLSAAGRLLPGGDWHKKLIIYLTKLYYGG